MRMTGSLDNPISDTPEDTSHVRVQDTSEQTNVETRDPELVARGMTIINQSRRGARHRIIVMGRAVSDKRVED